MTKTLLRAGALTCALLTTTCLTAPAVAQSTADAAPPQRHQIDENGVDVARGRHLLAVTDIAIGPDGSGGLAYVRQLEGALARNSFDMGLFQSGSAWTASVGLRSYTFSLSGSTYTSTDGSGATLVKSGTTHTLTTPEGIIVTYSYNVVATGDTARKSRATSILYPSGERTTLTWVSTTYCSNNLDGCAPNQVGVRLQAVSSTSGYQLHLNYGDATATILAEFNLWRRLNSITAINTTVDACNPAAHSCTYTQTWPTTSYSGSSVTDPVGRTASYSSTATTTTIRRPGSSSDDVVYTYSGGGITQVVRDGMTWGYNYSVSGNNATMVVTEPGVGRTRTIVSDLNVGLPTSVTDELGKVTGYAYDTAGRLTRITAPEGNYVQYSYDARGNVTEVRRRDKAGNSANDIVASASYPATCANPVTCNQPTTTTDARGNVTDYAYDATHGGVTSITGPAPTTGAVRPQVRYAYSALTLPGGGTTYRLSQVSQCQTLSSCTNQADETRTVIAYGQANLMPTSVTARDGTGALTATATTGYDVYARPITTDGPLTGSADTVRTRYNLAGEVVGVIGPDPDSTGPGKHRAQRVTYDGTTGLVTRTEAGTVNSQSDADWAAFAPLETVEMSYDAYRRPVRQILKGSDASVQAVSDLSYDAIGRPECSATRMNPSAWATVTAACTAQSAGSFGPDRIARTSYDLASRPILVQTGYGVTGVQADEAATSYTNNGQIETLTDAEGNRTTYEYDGFDRLLNTRYPSPTTDGVSAPTSGAGADFEQYGYDAAGNVTSRRLRSNQTVYASYDNLGRLSVLTPPTSEPSITFSYDALSRLVQAVQTPPSGYGQSTISLSYSYDALGRVTGETGQLGTMASEYDLAGRRTRLTWPDAFYVTYEYDTAGNMIAVKESGSTTLATYSYDSFGRRTGISRGNGTSSTYSYDNVSRLSQLVQNLTGTSSDLTLDFAYNPAGQLVSTDRGNNAYSFTGHANQNVAGTANGLNQLTSVGGSSLSHDSNGNVSAAGGSSYGYDSANRLRTATVGSNNYALYYEPAGRLSQTGFAGIIWLGYDGATLAFEHEGGASIARRYVFGAGLDEPLVWYEGSGTATRRYFHADERGSIVAVSDGSGNLVGPTPNRYDEYGNPQGTLTGRFGYTGQVWLPEPGLYYYRARIYNPALGGRFMQTDPIGYGGGMNVYAYVGNDPVNLTDPFGLSGNDDPPPKCVGGEQCVTVIGEPIRDFTKDVMRDLQQIEIRNDVFRASWRPEGNTERSDGTSDGASNSRRGLPRRRLPTDAERRQCATIVAAIVTGTYVFHFESMEIALAATSRGALTGGRVGKLGGGWGVAIGASLGAIVGYAIYRSRAESQALGYCRSIGAI